MLMRKGRLIALNSSPVFSVGGTKMQGEDTSDTN